MMPAFGGGKWRVRQYTFPRKHQVVGALSLTGSHVPFDLITEVASTRCWVTPECPFIVADPCIACHDGIHYGLYKGRPSHVASQRRAGNVESSSSSKKSFTFQFRVCARRRQTMASNLDDLRLLDSILLSHVISIVCHTFFYGEPSGCRVSIVTYH